MMKASEKHVLPITASVIVLLVALGLLGFAQQAHAADYSAGDTAQLETSATAKHSAKGTIASGSMVTKTFKMPKKGYVTFSISVPKGIGVTAVRIDRGGVRYVSTAVVNGGVDGETGRYETGQFSFKPGAKIRVTLEYTGIAKGVLEGASGGLSGAQGSLSGATGADLAKIASSLSGILGGISGAAGASGSSSASGTSGTSGSSAASGVDLSRIASSLSGVSGGLSGLAGSLSGAAGSVTATAAEGGSSASAGAGSLDMSAITGKPVPYKITMTAKAPKRYESEPNGTRPKANKLKQGQFRSGNVIRDDTDWFVFKAKHAGTYKFAGKVKLPASAATASAAMGVYQGSKELGVRTPIAGDGYEQLASVQLAKGQKVFVKVVPVSAAILLGQFSVGYNVKVVRTK